MSAPERPTGTEAPHEVLGYVYRLSVERMSERDQLWFKLALYDHNLELAELRSFMHWLDQDVTVGLAMLQMLKMAMAQRLPVYVRYWFDADQDSPVNHVYKVRVYDPSFIGYGFPMSSVQYKVIPP